MAPLEILYHDNELIAINKPAGLLVHRSRIDVRATEFAIQRLRDQIGRPVYPVHRIDRPTSGVLLFAFCSDIARAICQQFERREIDKQYEAIVRGHSPINGRTDEALVERKDATDQVSIADPKPQPAITEYSTIQSWTIPYSTGKYPTSRYSHVLIKPLTGRRHQIRRHFNHLAYPIIGDTTHGDRRHNRLFREVLGVNRLLLVATRMSFCHPESGRSIEIEASVGKEFKHAIAKLCEEQIRTESHGQVRLT